MYYLRFRPPPLTPLQGPKLGLNPILSAWKATALATELNTSLIVHWK
jgi:hypothetical protein